MYQIVLFIDCKGTEKLNDGQTEKKIIFAPFKKHKYDFKRNSCCFFEIL
jgi:hypothetical protein